MLNRTIFDVYSLVSSSLNAIGRAVLQSTSTKMSSETSDSESSDDDDASNSSNSDDDAGEDVVKPVENKKSGREETGGAGTMVRGLFYCC